MTRRACLLLTLCTAGLLAACGGDEQVAGARLRVLTSAADGPLQGALQLQSLEDGAGRIYDTKPLGDDVFVAPGAPPGKYRVFTTADWGMLWSGRQGSAAPSLRGSGYPVTTVRLGKPRSLYVASGMPGRWTLSGTWGADWKRAADGDKAQFQRVDLQVEDQGDGLFALRFPADVWTLGNVVRVLGLTTDGIVTGMESYQLRDEEHVLLPRMALVLAATQAALTVNLVPPPGTEQVLDGTPVRVTLQGVALEHTYHAQSFGGRARFDELAALGHDLRVELPASGTEAVFRIDPSTWRIRKAMHIVAVDPTAATYAEIEEIEGSPYTDVLVCYRGGTHFGRVHFERVLPLAGESRHRVRLRTHPGVQEWWLRTAGDEWVYAVADVPPAPQVLRLQVGRSQGRSVRVRGTVRGQRQGSRVVFRQVHEARADDSPFPLPARRLSGDGFEAAVSPQGGYEVRLPPGRYEIRVLGPAGSGGRPTVLTFKPGSEVRWDPKPR